MNYLADTALNQQEWMAINEYSSILGCVIPITFTDLLGTQCIPLWTSREPHFLVYYTRLSIFGTNIAGILVSIT